jgi:glycine rich protein/type IX secretion system substrate protein/Big-like domain-containing protein
MKQIYISRLFVLAAIFSGWSVRVNAQTSTYAYTGSMQTYVVPAGVTSINIDMSAAKGGDYPGISTGGYGGRVQATMAVTPLQTYNVFIGAVGANGGGGIVGAGGSNSGGGANGGSGSNSNGGAAGGGSTDLRFGGTALANRVIVAGAGAGGAWDCGENGGPGGGLTGGNGYACGVYFSPVAGGSQTGGGYGTQTNGSLGAGGNAYCCFWGSGGGGGYYGGGGMYSGSGGGGSSYPASAGGSITAITHTQGYCATNGSMVITVNCSAGTITGPTAACTGFTAQLTDAVTGGAWTSSNTTIATVNSGGLVTGVAAGVCTISYGGALPCGTLWTTYAFTVSAAPTGITGSSTICKSQTQSYTVTGSGGTWSTSNTTLATINTSGVATGVASGGITITYGLSATCYAVKTGVTVLPTAPTIAATPTVCAGLTDVITNANPAGGTGTWTSSNTTVATIDPLLGIATGVLTVLSPTVVNLNFTETNGCVMSTPVTVNPLPATFGIAGGIFQVCLGLTATLSETSTGGAWTTSNSAVAPVVAGSPTTGVVTGLSAGTSSIVYTLPTGCLMTQTMTVNPLPASIVGNPNICLGLNYTMSDVTPGGVWTASNANASNAGAVYTGVTAGPLVITYTLPTTCIATMAATVQPNPAVPLGNTTVCVGQTSLLTDATFGGSWTSGNTSFATMGLASGLLTGVSAGAPAITYMLPTGCINTTVATINPLPSAIGTPPGGAVVCVGSSINLTDGGTGTWTSSNPGLASVPLGPGTSAAVLGIVAGNPTITYQLTATGCYATIPVTVNPVPAPITGGSQVCVGSTTTLNDASAGGVWSSSATTTATIGTTGLVTGVAAGTPTNISYTFATGCAATRSETVNALPTLFGLSIPPGLSSGSYCAGGTGLDVQLASSAVGVNYQLFYGGLPLGSPLAGTGSALDFGPKTGAGAYTCVATNATTGCSRAMPGTVTISINPLPASSTITITNGGNFCAGGSGVDIFDSLSQTGILYQLYNGGTPVFSPVPGTTGTKLDFGTTFGALFTTPGVYTIVATNPATTCSTKVTGSVTVTANAVPLVFNVTGGGNYCAGTSGAHVGLSYSSTGITYQLWNAGTLVASVPGSNSGLDFGARPSGTYTVVAINSITGCTSNMTGSATVIMNSLPNTYLVSAPGSSTYCAGGSGVDVQLNGSDLGISYQLYLGGTPMGSPIAGTGSGIDFGFMTIKGTYTVIAVDGGSGCTISMGGSVTVATYPLMTPYIVNESVASYCAMGVGTDVTLSGSTSAVSYQLYSNGVAVPGPSGVQIGTGAVLDFGNLTTGGVSSATFTVIATNPLTTCSLTMLGNPTVTENTLPVAYNVTGGNGYCAGSAGVNIGLSFSDPGIRYQLWKGGVAIGSPVMGSSSALDFGTFTITGTYTIIGTNTLTGCSSSMTGSAVVIINPLPTVYTVSGGGSYCVGGTGKHVMLSGSATGINYQLFNSGVPVGSPWVGTGSAIDFGLMTDLGMYTVVGIDGSTSCTSNMSGSAVITTNPLPSVFNVTGGGSFCAGSTGKHVGLSGSTSGISYQLYNGGPVGVPVAGTGASIDFGVKTAGGTYTTVATNGITGCTSNMSGGVAVIVNPLPNVYSVTGGGAYCAGTGGPHIMLNGSDAGVNYQAYNGGMPIGVPVTGTGAPLDLGVQTAPGTYTVVGSSAAGACTMNMTGSTSVIVNPSPAAYTITGGGHYCAGGAGFAIKLSGSKTGISYQLYNTGTAVGSPVSGTGTGLNFGMQTATGTYTVMATDATTGCTNNMTSSGTINIDPTPVAFAIGGGGHYCAGGAGVAMNLSGSEPGVNYQLFEGATPSGLPVGGTGTILNFGLQTISGAYTVVGTNNTTTCSANMTGTQSVNIDPVVTPAVTISSAKGAATCVGTANTYTAMPVNGGSSPTYAWTVGGASMGGGSTFAYIPSDGDLIAVKLTSDANCATSATAMNSLTASVLPYKIASATVATNPGNNVCQGTSVTFTATPALGGSTPGYWWLKNSVFAGTGTTYTYTPVSANNGDVIVFMLKTSYLCPLADTVFSDPVVMIVDANALPVFTISSHLGPKIGVGQVDTFVAAVTPVTGATFSYQWELQNTPIPGATDQMYIDYDVFNGDVVNCVVTKDGACGGQSVSHSTNVHLSDVGVKPVITAASDISVLPNPNKGEFTIKGSLGTATDEEVTLEVTNMVGQVVYNNKIMAQNGNINQKVQISKTIANGMYILNLRSAVANNVYHIVIEQ